MIREMWTRQSGCADSFDPWSKLLGARGNVASENKMAEVEYVTKAGTGVLSGGDIRYPKWNFGIGGQNHHLTSGFSSMTTELAGLAAACHQLRCTRTSSVAQIVPMLYTSDHVYLDKQSSTANIMHKRCGWNAKALTTQIHLIDRDSTKCHSARDYTSINSYEPPLISNNASILFPRSPPLASSTQSRTSASTLGNIWASVLREAALACACALSISACTADKSKDGVGVRKICCP